MQKIDRRLRRRFNAQDGVVAFEELPHALEDLQSVAFDENLRQSDRRWQCEGVERQRENGQTDINRNNVGLIIVLQPLGKLR
jgi:hypothetical protein